MVVLFGRQVVPSHPIHGNDFSAGLEDSLNFAKKSFPIAVVAGTLDIDHDVNCVVGKGQALAAVRVLETDPVGNTRIDHLLFRNLQLEPVQVHASDSAATCTCETNGGTANATPRIHHVMVFLDHGRFDHDVNHAFHRSCQPCRIPGLFAWLGQLSRLE